MRETGNDRYGRKTWSCLKINSIDSRLTRPTQSDIHTHRLHSHHSSRISFFISSQISLFISPKVYCSNSSSTAWRPCSEVQCSSNRGTNAALSKKPMLASSSSCSDHFSTGAGDGIGTAGIGSGKRRMSTEGSIPSSSTSSTVTGFSGFASSTTVACTAVAVCTTCQSGSTSLTITSAHRRCPKNCGWSLPGLCMRKYDTNRPVHSGALRLMVISISSPGAGMVSKESGSS
mmetsp:Transcript_7521/g.11221  ORF Transcript_7521/g.11221 Transcript_7521/m.11221 type:complete len:231 (-) Transcript_7521:298-990(-)